MALWIQPLDSFGIDDEDELQIMCLSQVYKIETYYKQLIVEGIVVVEW